ncbi:hypothetical protein [Denitratisoma oestradiolicum]|jgi:hypothetical protein|uniref:Lipoprotein n=1 Tax=Denitratisoma oestradiolicum TaxID=311182 RepID=A0A6S6Y1I6_9PROT|nr:hypothetical protein [Denitratisoma oestradiolicum]TWO82123.1 hypothetical protein CBW56_01395 [Denitratisoma oestradiolicum]CAB1369054.1 conserved exported protein of unknown function [Denitratisoma oestradiolicum]
MIKRTLLSSLLMAGLAGCAASPDLPSAYTLDSNRPEGLAIVSLTLSGKPLEKVSGYEYRIREVLPRGEAYAVVSQHYASARQHARAVQEGGKERPFTHSVVVKGPNNTDALDIQDGGKTTGRLAAIRLLPGEYEFHTWQVREPSPYGETEYRPARDFVYRFSIKPGEATYIGRLNLYLGPGNIERIAIKDRQAEDTSLLGHKYPALRTARLTASVGTIQP